MRARESGRKLAEEAAPRIYTSQKRRIKNQGGQLLNYICRSAFNIYMQIYK